MGGSHQSGPSASGIILSDLIHAVKIRRMVPSGSEGHRSLLGRGCVKMLKSEQGGEFFSLLPYSDRGHSSNSL